MKLKGIGSIETLKGLCKKHGVSSDLIDWEADVDMSLTYEENKTLLLPKIKTLSRGGDADWYEKPSLGDEFDRRRQASIENFNREDYKQEVFMIGVNEIIPDINQPRKHTQKEKYEQLKESILCNELIHPISIDKDKKIIVGEMRWQVFKELKILKIPCIFRNVSGERERLVIQLSENNARQSLTTIELAEAVKRLFDQSNLVKRNGERYKGYETIAREIGMSATHVRELLRVAEMPEETKLKIESKGLSMNDALQRPERQTTLDQFYRELSKKAEIIVEFVEKNTQLEADYTKQTSLANLQITLRDWIINS